MIPGVGIQAPVGIPGALPFGGIPPEYRERVAELLADEPAPEPREVELPPAGEDGRRQFDLWHILRPQRAGLLIAALLVTGEQIALLVGPLLFGIGIDSGVRARNPRVLAWVVVAYFASIALHLALNHVRIRATARVGQRLMYSLRLSVFRQLQTLGLDFYTREKSGRIMTRMTSDVQALSTLFHEGFVNLAVQGMTLLVVVSILAWRNPRLAGVVLAVILPVMVVATVWFRGQSRRAYDRVRERIADVLADLQESLAGVRVVAMFNRQRHNVLRHRRILARHRDANIGAARIAAIYGPGTTAVDIGAQAIVLVIGGHMVARGELSPGDLAAFVLYVGTFFSPIQELVQLYNTYQSGDAALRKLKGVFAEKPSIREARDAIPLPRTSGHITFDRVSFGYDPERLVLREIELDIPAGTSLALVGPTGAGKSTVAKLLTRLYDPVSGSLCIDGYDLRKLQIDSLRRQIGVVPQEPFLFRGTIRENVAFARPDANDDEVLTACEAVGIRELIERLPRGIETPCHERGVTLSAGERQLIALARTFMAQPRVLILDEATSNLDLRTESLVEHALDVLLEGRTAILIAHRLSTAIRADAIAVLEHGRISELGNHSELAARGGSYAAMVAAWNRATHA